jgi:glutamine synthetase
LRRFDAKPLPAAKRTVAGIRPWIKFARSRAPEERNFAEVIASGGTVRRIPTTLRDALDALADDDVIRSVMPGELYRIYDEYKRDKWNRFIGQTSDRDVKTYLDCLP